MRKRLLALLMVTVLCIGILPISEAMISVIGEWVGGNDPNCQHPSDKVHSIGTYPIGQGEHANIVECEICGAQFGNRGYCEDNNKDGKCDACNQTMPGGDSHVHNYNTLKSLNDQQHAMFCECNQYDPNSVQNHRLKESDITPGSTGFPYGGKIIYCEDNCGYYKEIPNDPPQTTTPPTDPPATTAPPTDPPATTAPPTDPPATTAPPKTDPPKTEPPYPGVIPWS